MPARTKMIKKMGSSWRIKSGKTGRLWKAHYKTSKSAHAGLRGYFARRGK